MIFEQPFGVESKPFQESKYSSIELPNNLSERRQNYWYSSSMSVSLLMVMKAEKEKKPNSISNNVLYFKPPQNNR